MFKRISKYLLIFSLLLGGLLLARLVLAQDFGTEAVNNGLDGALGADDPRTITGRIINIALGVLGVIAVGIVIVGGFIWMTSGGNEEKLEKAKKLLKNGVIGLVIILASWAIATFILTRLGGAISGNGNGCFNGETSSCGCGGYMICNEGYWSGCINSNCGGGPGPTSCDSDPNPGCQATSQICASEDYCDENDCGCKPKGGTGDPCDADLNNATCEPDNNRCAAYLTCSLDTCTCFGPPVITEISPIGGFCDDSPNQACINDNNCTTTCNLIAPNGTPDNFITVFGQNFGEYSPGISQIIFEGNNNPREGVQPVELNPACISSWSNEQIVIAVPAGVSNGAIKVVSLDNLSDTTADDYGPKIPDFEANDIARPGLCHINPNRGVLSSEVGYQGINLYTGDAYFGNYQSNVRGLDPQFNNPIGLSGTATTPNIKSGDSGSFVINNLNGNNQKSNYLKFVKEQEPGEGPFIVSFTPSAGSAGQYVTIQGNGFGGARGLSKVYFGDTEAAYDFPSICLDSVWRDDQIIVKVPAGLENGYQIIKIDLGEIVIDTQRLNPNTFEINKNLDLKTSLCKIKPILGPIDTPVSLWGEYFGQVGADGLVKFNYDKSTLGEIAKDGQADNIITNVPLEAITGPVKVIKNNDWGNELNFEVGECSVDADCGNQICCPQNTFKKGRCADTLMECFLDIPTSVFEWDFNTGFGNATDTNFYSCAGMSKYLGACQSGATCPNIPGTCSPYAGTGQKKVGSCDYSCVTVPGCNNFGPNNCTYDADLNRCLKNGEGASCDLAQAFSFVLGNTTYEAVKTCNADKHWEISIPTSCPTGWTRISGNRCVDLNSNCLLCSTDFSCQKIGSNGRCASDKICPSGATCQDNPNVGEPDDCVIPDKPSCDCCCEIGQDERDCCAPLKCAGTCGLDITDDDSGLGLCSGCALVGTTTAEHDAACNCTGHSGQYCDISPLHPDGVCTDCTSLATQQNCVDHSGSCCIDAKRTSTTTDDICRGGDGQLISNDPFNPNYGYCAYYDCQTPPADPTLCASSTPLKLALYENLDKCTNGCAANPGLDYCWLFNGNQSACIAEEACCFDKTTSNCLGGAQISGGTNTGYCAYYDCRLDEPKLCDYNATTTGRFTSTSTCEIRCANEEGGAGLSCASQTTTSDCNFGACNLPNFSCLTDGGSLGSFPDCGTCCCQPDQTPDSCLTPETPTLHCQADRGSCAGANRGLCCGCTKDSECGYVNTIGCGSDSCCQARPEIASSSPAHLDNNICRNAVIKINFNQSMDAISFNNSVLLLEEREYGNGVCPVGTFITKGDSLPELLAYKNQNLFQKFTHKITFTWHKLVKRFSGTALADVPDPNKLYCAIPGVVSSEEGGDKTSLVFAPQKLLSPSTNYYLVVKGDEELNSQIGVLSLVNIGMNGEGYLDPSTSSFVEGEFIKFNNRSYKNSHIIKFTTISDQGPRAGICAIDHVSINPISYLFKTTTNDLNENDNPGNLTFDTKADRDKLFAAWAYSSDQQALQPVTGYFWDWLWNVDNLDVVFLSSLPGLAPNTVFVTANQGITDAETKINAAINMDRFLNMNTCDNSPSCVCQDNNCLNNCCNVYSTGNEVNKNSDIYIFICNNPWPPIDTSGNWYPWSDNCNNAIGSCADYNYKFYYCRDAGNSTTLDDLPAIINQAVIRGQSSNLTCSSDKTPCSTLGATCGLDQNGDGQADGLCIWNILKESYFFRETILPGGEIINVIDQQIGGTVKVDWQSAASQVGSYKIYYLKSNKGSMAVKELKPVEACNLVGTVYDCSAIIDGLTNGVSYVFKISVISINKTESQLSNEKTAIPTDKVSPGVPGGLKAELGETTIKFSWDANSDDTLFYRLYRGIDSSLYGESFDSVNQATSLIFNQSQFTPGDNYFALSALDNYNNESAKSAEIKVVIPVD